MIDQLLESVAPHHCYGCGNIGTLLCANCKNNITDEVFAGCVACGQLATRHGLCDRCSVPYRRAWCAAERSGVIEQLIDGYKFAYAQAAARPLGDLLHEVVSVLPPETVIVPIPTIPRHIRQRGYDHMALIARQFARQRQLSIQPLLLRRHTLVQHSATRKERIAQAKQAFRVEPGTIEPDRPYLLLDDIVTTGSTLHYGALALKRAGAKEIWVAAIARQPLD